MNDDDNNNEAREGALLIIAIALAVFVLVSLIVAFLIEAGYINL